MVTTAALADSDVLLVGTLHQHRRGTIAGRPYLQIVVHCPICKAPHYLPWPDTFRLDSAEMVTAPCPKGPWAGGRVAVSLDPDRMAEHRRMASDFAARLRRWKTEARLREQFATERSKERAYRREGWGIL
jgi:hypothetical protein